MGDEYNLIRDPLITKQSFVKYELHRAPGEDANIQSDVDGESLLMCSPNESSREDPLLPSPPQSLPVMIPLHIRLNPW